MIDKKKQLKALKPTSLLATMSLGETLARLLDIFREVDQDLIAQGKRPLGKRPEGYRPLGKSKTLH